MNLRRGLVGRAHSAYFLILLAIIFVASVPRVLAQGTRQNATQGTLTVTKYIKALQARDFKTIIDLTASYQAEIAQIKSQNPQVLWSKLIKEYYDGKISAFSKQPDFWGDYGEAMAAMMGDPAKDIRSLAALFPPPSRWKITETRNQGGIITYVSVDYEAQTTSPIVGGKRLRKTIVQFQTDARTGLVQAAGRLAAGDEYWPIPPITADTMSALIPNFHEAVMGVGGWMGIADEITPYVFGGRVSPDSQCCVINFNKYHSLELMPQVLDFLRQHGFRVGSTSEDQIAHSVTVRVEPPETWNKYQLAPGRFRLSESTHVRVLNVDGSDVSGLVKVHLTFEGCSLPCQMVNDFYASGLNSKFGGWAPRELLLANCPTCGNDGRWFAEEDGLASIVWDPVNLRWKGAAFKLTGVGPAVQPNLQAQAANSAQPRAPSARPGVPANDAKGAPAPAAQFLAQFQLAHRHSTFFNLQTSQAQSFCSGVLAVLPDGTVKYDCSQTRDPSGRCDHITFAPDSFKSVKIGLDGSLHIATKTQGNFDFVGNRNSIKQAYNLITAGPSRKSSPPETSSAPETAPPSTPTCSQSADAGYSLLLQGRLYRVQTVGPAGPNQVHLFFDDKNRQVTDSSILQQLTAAAWTRDNVVASPDARNSSRHVAAVLETSQQVVKYSAEQDLVARGMVASITAAATGGASLGTALKFTGAVVLAQLKSSPKTIFALAAQNGLQQSKQYYEQMERSLPPQDATALSVPDLLNAETLFIQARTLELPYEAVAVALMPKSGGDLWKQGLASAISQFVSMNPAEWSASNVTTLKDLLDLQTGVANAGAGLASFKEYSQNMNLALNLAEANRRTITKNAAIAATPCGQGVATGTRPPVVGSMMSLRGPQYAVVPFVSYSGGQYQTLPDGTSTNSLSNLGKNDLLPSGEANSSSPKIQAAVRQSPLNEVKDFVIYRKGKRIGAFAVSTVKVEYDGAIPKVVGIGRADGFTPQDSDIAVGGAASHEGFWSSATLTPTQLARLRSKALALFPKTVPPNRTQSQLGGKPLVVGKTSEYIDLFDLNHDGNLQAFLTLNAALRVSAGSTLPDGFARLLATYSRAAGDWSPLLSSVFSGDGEALFGDHDYQLLDVLDIDGDGSAELVFSKGLGEVGDLEIYRFSGGRLSLVCKISGWSGS